jgi:putative ABC transport system permease protein
MLSLGFKSLWNRRFGAFLTILSVALSVTLILGVERLRDQARQSFANSASGLDLIVAARDNHIQILMATVFGVGSTSQSIDWNSFRMIAAQPQVDWAVPISLGDNHGGFPVVGTTDAYFERVRHSGGQELQFVQGGTFQDETSAVVGAGVAARFGYEVGTVIVNTHGAGAIAFHVHDEAPFTITGVLAPTGTAVDRMVFVPLEGFDALHQEADMPPEDPFAMVPSDAQSPDHQPLTTVARAGKEPPSDNQESHDQTAVHSGHDAEHEAEHRQHEGHGAEHRTEHRQHEGQDTPHGYTPKQINAMYIGLADRTAILGLQRLISSYPGEPLTAVLPNVALLELWAITSAAERALRVMAWAVAVAGLLGLVVMLSVTLDARRREFAILRSVGATPFRIFALIVIEAAILTLAGIALGLIAVTLVAGVAGPLLAARAGITLGFSWPNIADIALLAVILLAGLLAGLVPAARVYRLTLNDGLTIRL